MKAIFTFILFSPLFIYSQTQEEVVRIINENYKNGNLDSLDVKIWLADNDYYQVERYQNFYVMPDTIIDSSNNYSIGLIILDPFMQYNNRKIGEWKGYHPNGQLQYIGNYSIGATIWCQVAGPTVSGYNIKSGIWSYFHVNGQLEAKGLYIHSERKVFNSCGTETIYEAFTGSEWHYWDQDGKEIIKPKEY